MIRTGRPNVILADPDSARRQMLARSAVATGLIEAATLQEAYLLAEELGPDMLVLAVDFLLEPELEGLLRLARMLGCRVLVYSPAGWPNVGRAVLDRVVCVPLGQGDRLDDLIARRGRGTPVDDPDQAQASVPELILIGASTGGIAAVERVLVTFPADCPPTLIVQHIREGFVPGLVQRLDMHCRPRVVEAADQMPLQRGTIYFAADANRHLTLAGRVTPRCALVAAPPRHGHRPAVDPLFESAISWGAKVAAGLLTGMGSDGAAGLGALRAAGSFTIAQDQTTSTVWGMPRAAIEAGAAETILPLQRIGPALLHGRATGFARALGGARA